MKLKIYRTGKNRKKGILVYIITLAITLPLIYSAFNLNVGKGFVKADDGTTHYYLPDRLEGGGILQAGSLKKPDKNGHEIIWYNNKLLYSGKYGYDQAPKAFAADKKDIGKNLYGCYYEDGRFAYALFRTDKEGADGIKSVSQCLEIAFYDEEEKNAEHYALDCGKAYADNIAAALHPSQALSRIFIVCTDNGLEIYVGEDERDNFDEGCEMLNLRVMEKTDCSSYLKAILLSSGDDRCMDMAAERAAELLRNGYDDSITKKKDFEVVVVKN